MISSVVRGASGVISSVRKATAGSKTGAAVDGEAVMDIFCYMPIQYLDNE